MALRCPVCNETWLDEAPRCVCGYDFIERDPRHAILRLEDLARRSRRTWYGGLALLATIPIGVACTLLFLPDLLVVILALLPVQLGLGAAYTVGGLVRNAREHRQLAASREMIELPTARLRT